MKCVYLPGASGGGSQFVLYRVPHGDGRPRAAELPESFAAAGSANKTMHMLKGARHYYQGQPKLQARATQLTLDWMGSRKLLAN